MRALSSISAALAVGLLLLLAYGCSTNQPGAKYTVNTYTTNLDAKPDSVTDAAKKACEDLKFNNIQANGTAVDGHVTAQTADNRTVTISIEQNGDNVSKIAIQVGDAGDQAVSQQIVDRTKSHLHWL